MLSAMLSADVAGYSRLMGVDEAATVGTPKLHRNLITEKVQILNKRVVNPPIDNILSELEALWMPSHVPMPFKNASEIK